MFHRVALVGLSILLLVISGVAAAEGFDVDITPLQDTIGLGGQASYQVQINNNLAEEDSFRIYYSQVEWDVSTDPLTDSTLEIVGGRSKQTTVVLKPRSANLELDELYLVPINVRATSTGEIEKVNVPVNLLSEERRQNYLNPFIRGNLLMDELIDPREEVVIRVRLENLNTINYPEVLVELESDLLNEQQTIALEPSQQKTIEFTIPLDARQPAIRDRLAVYVSSDQISRRELDHLNYNVLAYGSIVESKGEQESFMKKETTYTLHNDANDDNYMLFKVKKPFFSFLVTETNPEAIIIKEEEGTFYAWDIMLDPQEQRSVTVTNNYRIIIWLLIIIGAGVALYFILRPPIVLVKSTSHVVKKEGGISELKIVLVMKNRSPRSIEDVKVRDKVPAFAEVIRENGVGALHANVVKHQTKGTMVAWDIDSLEGFEERILSYRIKSKFSILGAFRLPTATATYMASGRRRKTVSNKAATKG